MPGLEPRLSGTVYAFKRLPPEQASLVPVFAGARRVWQPGRSRREVGVAAMEAWIEVAWIEGGLPEQGGRPGRSGDLRLKPSTFSRLALRRTRRRAWRGRSSSASLRASSLKQRRRASIRPSSGGGTGAAGGGAGRRVGIRGSSSMTGMRGTARGPVLRRWNVKRFRGSKS